MADPNNEIKGDLDEAARLRWQEKREDDPNIRKGLEQAAQGYEAEANQLENDSAEADSVEPEAPEDP